MKKALEGDDIEVIKTKTEELTQEFYKISEKLYKDMNQEGPQGDSSTDDDVVDGDYEVVDED